MKQRWIAVLALGLVAVTMLGARTAEPSDPELRDEVARLNVTLEQIREVLAQQLETEGLDLLLKRSELVSADVARLETRLRSVESERRSRAEDAERIRMQVEGMEMQLRSGGVEPSEEEYTAYMQQMEAELERSLRRVRELDGTIQELQNRLTAKQRDLRSWEDLVDRRLGGV